MPGKYPVQVFICGTIYASILSLLAMMNAGAGHGTYLPMSLTYAPLGFIRYLFDFSGFSNPLETWIFAGFFFVGTPIYWGTLLYLGSQSYRLGQRTVFAMLILFRYVIAVIVASQVYLEERMIPPSIDSAYISIWTVFFVLGEIAVWFLYFKSGFSSKSSRLS